MAINPIQQLVPAQFAELPDPTQSILGGLRLGAEINKLKQEQQAREQERLIREQYSTDLNNAINNPTQSVWAEMIAKYPGQREAFGDASKLYGADRVNNEFWQGAEISTALENNNIDAAKETVKTIIEANKNSGEPYGTYQQILDSIEKGNVKGAQAITNMTLSMLSPEKFKEMVSARTAVPKAEAELTEAQSKAKEAAVKADFAESTAALDLEKKGWDIAKIAEDIAIAKENQKIVILNAQLQREENALKKQELQIKLEEMKDKRDQLTRDRVSELETAYSGIDNSLAVIDRLTSNPELNNILGAVEGSSFYPSTLVGIVSPFSDADKRADAQADLENIQSQSFLNNLMEAKAKGATFGSLTEKEGDRLISYVRSLKSKQSEAQFRSNLSEIKRLLNKSRDNLANKYNVPSPRSSTATGLPPGFRILGPEQ